MPKIFMELVVLAEMVGEVVIVTLLVSEGDQVVIVVMGLLMDKVEEVEMALRLSLWRQRWKAW